MLNENFTYNYFEVAMMFRNSIMINGMLCSLEASNYLNKGHIETLEDCDKYLMSKIFMPGAKSPFLGYFWETGALPIRFVLMGRRILFLWSILQKDRNQLVKQIFDLQLLCPINFDWINQVKNDLIQCDLEFNEEIIKGYSKSKFKALVKRKIKKLAYDFFLENKSAKAMKLTDYSFQEYLSSHLLTLKQKRLLYQFRVRMVQSIHDNFKNY